MELLVAADSLLYRTPDGKYWCKTIYGYSFWVRYLDVFEDVLIVSRTHPARYGEVEGYLRVDGPHVRVSELPFLRGMKQYILNYLPFKKAAKEAVKSAECALIRLPSVSAYMILKYFKRKKKPYAIEVVADPYDAYSSNKLAQLVYTKKLKKAALQANGVSYVTEFYLQSRYPSNSRINNETTEYFESYYSTIDLPETYFLSPRLYNKQKRNYTIVHTANSINNDIKGHESLIKVIKKLREHQYDVNVIFIGDGNQREYYEEMALKLGVKSNVTFTGLLSSEKVREIIMKSDIFVFPTKAEGLPRAVIEAMAVGLPCLSTPVNGIPELLSEEYLFDPLDIEGFATKIKELINNPKKLENMSKENVEKAREYSSLFLTQRRKDCYLKLKNLVNVETPSE